MKDIIVVILCLAAVAFWLVVVLAPLELYGIHRKLEKILKLLEKVHGG